MEPLRQNMGFEKLQIEVVHTGQRIPVLFNPEHYSLNKSNTFAPQQIPGLSGPLVQFVSGAQRTLDMELFFDTYDTPALAKRDVRDLTGQVTKLMEIDATLHAPPVLRVVWSSLNFQCVLSKANQEFNLFSEDGTPVRATITVTFDEVIFPEQESQAVKRQTADFSKVHTVMEGETLSYIAGVLYDNPFAWRPIAIANGLADPRSIFVGQELRVPNLPFNDPASGEAVA